MNDLKRLIAAADSAREAVGGGWWWLTWIALETALWAAERAEEATGVDIDGALVVLATVEEPGPLPMPPKRRG